MFQNRHEAGVLLAKKLKYFRGANAIILALPRGGVVVGYEVAKALSLPLDIIVTRKIAHPASPEYAIGAIDEHGTIIVGESAAALVQIEPLNVVITKQREEAQRRTALYRKERPPLNLDGKTAILVDDGIATGFTMRLAVQVARRMRPESLVVAVPVAPRESIATLKKEGVAAVVTLIDPDQFQGAVGAHYEEFEQVSDDEVVRLLRSQ